MTDDTKIRCPRCRGYGRTTGQTFGRRHVVATRCFRCKGTGRITYGTLGRFETVPGSLACKADIEAAKEAAV